MSDFFKFLKSDPREMQADEDVNPVEMAAAVLLIEMARADFEQADLENATIIELLQEYFVMNLEDQMSYLMRQRRLQIILYLCMSSLAHFTKHSTMKLKMRSLKCFGDLHWSMILWIVTKIIWSEK